ncbi:DUF4189 domain-containing protein [Thermomonas fusca]|uniref:DUF4189 domain-containing protein n=1 Tax=Thermomonas fusca TaxID=215690 RepID=UPI0009FD635F
MSGLDTGFGIIASPLLRVYTSSLILVGALGSTFPANSQAPPPGRGPCGMGAPINGSCGSPSNAGNRQIAAPAEVWRSRYGAIARDADGNTVSTKDQESRRIARRKVLEECGKGCEIIAETRNSCLGIVNGYGRLYSGGAADPEATRNLLLSNCASDSRPSCEVVYVGCSYPVRVR